MFDILEHRFVNSKPYFQALAPGWANAFKGRAATVAKAAAISIFTAKKTKQWLDGKTLDEITAETLSQKTIGFALQKPSSQISKLHTHAYHTPRKDPLRKNGVGGRSWFYAPTRQDMVIVFHDANRVGPHVDVHIGRLSLVYRVKPEIYSQLKYNGGGYLTENSKKILHDFVKSEIANNSRVPQNLDHTKSNARATWTNGSKEDQHYGAATTRHVISESQVDIYKAHANGPIEFYAPLLNPDRSMYIYKLYYGDSKQAPILIWGNKNNNPPKLKERLHLKLINAEDENLIYDKTDISTSTAKYDGSSCYIITDKKSTRVYSPRTSKRTGQQIEYTFKVNGLASVTNHETVVGMGELMFYKRHPIWRTKHYLSQSQGSGILNSNELTPKNVTPEIKLYRIDRLGRTDVSDLDFWTNRKLQQWFASKSEFLDVVELMTPDQARKAGFEGVVSVPQGKSVNEGYKLKYWSDPSDWIIEKVDFYTGPKGGVAGVIRCRSLESNKTFNLGPGQVGNNELTLHMMQNPQNYEGSVIKVNSRHGHEGRASKMIGFHDDKGHIDLRPIANPHPHTYDLQFYANRSTPQVLTDGEPLKPKPGYGPPTIRRPATANETEVIKKGEWLRIDESGNTPKSDSYKRSIYRTHNQPRKYYVYTDADNMPLFRVVKLPNGNYMQQRYENREWINGRGKTQTTIYNLPDIHYRKKDPIFITEGEKDAEALIKFGYLATTPPQGAGKWLPEYNKHFLNRDVYILKDNDEVGIEHAKDVEQNLKPIAKSIKHVDLPDLEHKEDVSDWLAKGNKKSDFEKVISSIS